MVLNYNYKKKKNYLIGVSLIGALIDATLTCNSNKLRATQADGQLNSSVMTLKYFIFIKLRTVHILVLTKNYVLITLRY